jgi:hypothetical protein
MGKDYAKNTYSSTCEVGLENEKLCINSPEYGSHIQDDKFK